MRMLFLNFFYMKRRKLNMDANSIIPAFIASSNQYVASQNETNLMQLQRHLEILVCLTTTASDLGYFLDGNLLASQCITHVVNLLLDNNIKSTLIPRVLSILQNMSNCSQLNKILQSTFYVHSAISVFLQHYGTDVNDPLVIQCLNLLENLTYNLNIDYIESHFENLINVLLKLIDSDSSQMLKTTLRILANITRHNAKVQVYICSLPNAKQNVKKIVNMLNTEGSHVLVYALSILANLAPNYPGGSKLWTEDHLMSAFKLIIKLLFSTDETSTTAALDLFLDLIKIPSYQSCFIKSPYLNAFLKRLPKVLNNDNVEQSVVYLQILYALVKIPDCSQKVCTVLSVSEENTNKYQCQDIKIHPKIAFWCINCEINEKAHRLSLKLLKNFLVLNMDKFNGIENFTKNTVKDILANMKVPSLKESSSCETQLEAHITIFEIIILLCMKTDMKSFISQYINLKVCEETAKVLLNKSKIDECEINQSCIDLFLMILEVTSTIEALNQESEELSSKILSDLRAMHFLAYALTSNNSECVKRGLLLISLTKNESSLNMLSKNLLLRNTNIQKGLARNSEISDYSFASSASQPMRKLATPRNDSFEKSVDSVILKVEQGLNIKELKKSEVMELYEHKISILTRKEQELQNYLDTKTAALQTADLIMTQYKCRQADSDAEALRLRTLLKEFESRCEKATVQFEMTQKECTARKRELELALCKIKELQQSQKEQKELMQSQMSRQYEQKKSFEEEKAKLSEIILIKDNDKKALTVQLQQMEEEIKSKCKAYEALQDVKGELEKNIEELKKDSEKIKQNFEQKVLDLESALESAQQSINALEDTNKDLIAEMDKKIEDYNQQLSELDHNIKEQKEHIKIRDSKIADLNEFIKNLNRKLNEKDNVIKETELSINNLKITIEDLESKNSKCEQDKKMLEILCKRYESSIEKKDQEIKDLQDTQKQFEEEIEERDGQIKHLEDELEKHKYITGMIHQMTSKIPPPNK